MTTWRRAPQALWRRSGSRTLVATPDADEPFVFDGVASVTWDLLAEPMGEDELLQELVRRFDAEAATIRRETNTFLEHLRELGAAVRT